MSTHSAAASEKELPGRNRSGGSLYTKAKVLTHPRLECIADISDACTA